MIPDSWLFKAQIIQDRKVGNICRGKIYDNKSTECYGGVDGIMDGFWSGKIFETVCTDLKMNTVSPRATTK